MPFTVTDFVGVFVFIFQVKVLCMHCVILYIISRVDSQIVSYMKNDVPDPFHLTTWILSCCIICNYLYFINLINAC